MHTPMDSPSLTFVKDRLHPQPNFSILTDCVDGPAAEFFRVVEAGAARFPPGRADRIGAALRFGEAGEKSGETAVSARLVRSTASGQG